MKLYHRDLGEGEPLVILHGLLGGSDNWGTVGRRLAERFRVIMVDLRNHGRSPHNDSFDYGVMSGDVNELLQDMGLHRINLVGHSMGGKVAMSYAQYYPFKVLRLGVVDIAPRVYHSTFFQDLIDSLMAVSLEGADTRDEAEARFADLLPDPAFRGFVLKNLRLRREGGYDWRVNLPAIRRALPHILGDIGRLDAYTGPAAFFRGERSDYVRDADIPLIRDYFPAADVITIPGAGHWVHSDAPDAFQDALLQFLTRPLPPSGSPS